MEEKLVFSIANIAIVNNDVLGYGRCLCIWVFGCNLRCEGCQSPEYQARKENNFSAKKLKQVFVEAVKQGINGVTVSGGEPLLQPLAIEFLGKLIAGHNKKTNDNLNLLVYTGYLYEEIKDAHKDALKYVDILIDGPYVKALDKCEGLRGSSNQKILFLSEKAKNLKEKYLDLLQERKNQVVYSYNNRFICVGLKKKGEEKIYERS